MSSACDPLAPLQRWITYTQNEVLQLKRELYEHKQEMANVQKIQQQQLDSVQTQIRESEQRVAELIDAVTELFLKQSKTQDLLTTLLSDFASLQIQTQAPQESNDTIPATQPYWEGVCVCVTPVAKDIFRQSRVSNAGCRGIVQSASNEDTAVFL